MISSAKTISYFIAFLLAMSAAWGQTTNQSGAVTGVITDQSSAAVPNAAVTLTSQLGAITTKTTG
ncbi:MAG: hypothetical protein ACJ73N_09155, partial [Bryobacteraceae bacterium]